MPRIPIDAARPGQKLTRPAATRTGVVMMQPGTELTTASIERLRNLGIDFLVVAGEAGPSDQSMDDVLAALDKRFTGHDHDAFMMQLKDVVARVLRSSLS